MTGFFPSILSHHTAENPQTSNPTSANRIARLRWAMGNRALIGLCLAVSLLLIGCFGGRSLGASTAGWSPVAAEGGVVYVGTLEGEVKALDDRGDNGVGLKWTFTGASEDPLQGVYSTPAIGEDLVYVSAFNGVLYALDKDSGDTFGKGWQRPVGLGLDREPLVAGPALNETGTVVVVGSEGGNLYSYNAKTGEPLGEPLFTADDKIWSTPVIRNGVVYFGSHDGNVYAVDLETGDLKWQSPFATDGAVVASPLLYKGMVIVGSFDKNLYAIDAANGTERWRFEGSHWFWAGAVANNSAIFVPSMDGYVYSLDAGGNLLWKWQRENPFPIISTPVLTQTGLVVADKDGTVSLWSINPGELGSGRIKTVLLGPTADIKASLFAVPFSGELTPDLGQLASPADQGGSIFVGDQDGKIRRIRLRDTRVLWCFSTKEGPEC